MGGNWQLTLSTLFTIPEGNLVIMFHITIYIVISIHTDHFCCRSCPFNGELLESLESFFGPRLKGRKTLNQQTVKKVHIPSSQKTKKHRVVESLI